MEIQAMPGKYYCELISDVRQLASGLFIAETIKEKPHRAKIISAGDNNIDEKGKIIRQSAKTGDIIHFSRVWNREKKIEGKTFLFVNENEIVAVERG